MWTVTPSLMSLFFTGIIIMILVLFCVNNYKSILRLPFYERIGIVTLISILIGVHGLIHLGLEVHYGFNPYKWIM